MPIPNPDPPAEQHSPYLPSGPEPLLFEEFQGINTSTTRVGVDEKQMAWCSGMMPIGPRYLRTLPGIGPALWTTPGPGIVLYDFANFGSIPVALIFLNEGSIWQVRTDTGAAMHIAGPGTINAPSTQSVGMTQWGSQYVIIVSNAQTNGYFIWDGTAFYSSGTLAPPVTITNAGSGYTVPPSVNASGGSGSGATFSVTINVAGNVTNITILTPGSGYLPTDSVTLNFSGGGGGSGAAATVKVMPSGILGSDVETYAGRVWVINGPNLTWSAPGSIQDFSTADGGGTITSNDSFLRVGYTRLIQTNGFLYLIGDSSINYISGVQTSGTPPTTTFTNQNADPEVGTPYGYSADVFGRNIVFANSFGVHVSYGAAVTKVSEALDGVWNSVPGFHGFQLSSAKVTIYGKKTWVCLVPIIDPITGNLTNTLFMWDGKTKWWSSTQDVTLTFIEFQEINSVLIAWGTDGGKLFQLFTNPSTGFTKTVQSKLWARPGGYQFVKSVVRFWELAQWFSTAQQNVTVTIDTELNSQTYVLPAPPITMNWTTASGAAMNWTTAGALPMLWTMSELGIRAFPEYAVGQQGITIGMTQSTQAADMAIISAMMQPEVVAYRG